MGAMLISCDSICMGLNPFLGKGGLFSPYLGVPLKHLRVRAYREHAQLRYWQDTLILKWRGDHTVAFTQVESCILPSHSILPADRLGWYRVYWLAGRLANACILWVNAVSRLFN